MEIKEMLEWLSEITGESPEEIWEAAREERARMVKEGAIKTIKTPHGDIDIMIHPLLKNDEWFFKPD